MPFKLCLLVPVLDVTKHFEAVARVLLGKINMNARRILQGIEVLVSLCFTRRSLCRSGSLTLTGVPYFSRATSW
jgi:hypothetical protein